MSSAAMDDDEKSAAQKEFRALVNMTPAKLRAWLATEESQSVGMTHEGEKVTGAGQGESVGHLMGERIIEIRGKKQGDLSDQDYADMRKVVGYIHRHSKQRPHGDITDTRWRKSLMNWGHDPATDKD